MRAIGRAGFVLVLCLWSGGGATAADDLPRMKFNDVKEVAPGVFFRYSAISPTDPAIFGGSNNIWVVCQDYVVVIDANFPNGAREVIAAIKKTTDKPIRYVFDTHHHGDHAYGNAVFAGEGASVVAQANCARLLRVDGPQQFKEAGRGPTGRQDVAQSTLKVPTVIFDDKLVLDDGKQRIEFLFLGHAHTAGDGFAYLPKYRLLCTGDACVNGAFNFMGHADSASWVRVLERAQQLDVKLICPGHGPLARKDLLDKQKRYFVELRKQVQQGIDQDKTLDDIARSIDMPWYKDWTGVEAGKNGENIKYVYGELTGRVGPWDLAEDFGIYAGPSPTKDSKGWTKPRRIVVPNLMPTLLNQLKQVAPDVLFVPVKTAADAAGAAEDADAVLEFCTADIIRAGKKLRWIQLGSRGIDNDLAHELKDSPVVLTSVQRVYGPDVAEQAFALLLSLSRGVRTRVEGAWRPPPTVPRELHGRTMLVVGLGGIGTEISRRAHAFGMRVMAVGPREMERPAFVFSLDRLEKLMELLPKADVVVLACPLTAETRNLIGDKQLRAMKKTAYLINIARGGLVRMPALVEALEEKRIAGAGLDVTDPEPLPQGHPLWKLPNAVVTPHVGGRSAEGRQRQWRLWRENVRRFAAGEPLLCVLDKEKGY